MMYAKIKKWYQMGLWNETMVRNAARKNVLTEDQAAEIIMHGSDQVNV